MTRQIEVLPDKAAVVARGLAKTVDVIHHAVRDRGYCTLALSGGSTPKPLYEGLAQQDLPWDKLYIFWGDERYVPVDHLDSNAGMAQTAWLEHVAIPTDHIFPMPTSTNPAADAATYDQTIYEFFAAKTGEAQDFPAFDLIMLGMGDDAHTASLFPHTDALQICDRRVTVGNKDGEPRLTFTVPLINCARTVMFLVTGESKQPALAQVFAPEASYETYPSRFIQPQSGELLWVLDQAAGAQLDPAWVSA